MRIPFDPYVLSLSRVRSLAPQEKGYLDSQVAGNNGPLYPKVDHYWFKVVAQNYEPLALQVDGKSRNQEVLGRTPKVGASAKSENTEEK